MTDRDRLVELTTQAWVKWDNLRNDFLDEKIDDIDDFEDVLADHLLANGVILPPCKVGDKVWYVDDFTEEIEECKVYGFNVVNGKLSLLVDNGECKFITRKWHDTKEEAEEKLKELKNNA